MLFISSIYLFSIDSRYNNPQYNKNWFALYFSNPKSNNSNFVIENFSASTKFHWEITNSNKEKILENNIQINSGEKKEIPIDQILTDKKIIIRVSTDNSTQEIYKNLTNL